MLGINVYALTYRGCDYASVSRMKSLVTNINVAYDYRIIDNKAYFSVTLTNIFPEVYFVDSSTGNKYTYNNTNNGEITIYNYTINSGSYKFYSNLSECYGTSLGTKYYKFPSYNIYYNSESCKDIPNFSLCQKWISVNYSNYEFENLVKKYKEDLDVTDEEEDIPIIYEKSILDDIVNIYINNYYYFLIAIIVLCAVVMIITRRKDRFKL